MKVGIELLNIYAGRAFLDVGDLVRARGLDEQRFQNLLLKQKTVAFNFEDPVSFAVNAARPLVDELSPEARKRIELLVIGTESGLDFGKSMSTYVHHYLQLSRECRTFELKHACYAGTAGLQMAACFVLANTSPGALRPLVITTDVARPIPHTYAEPSQGAAAAALLIGDQPAVLELEPGAAGYYGYEVMDSCRPTTEIETGDADLSLLSYLDCIEHCFQEYCRRVGPVDFQTYFDYLAFHTPFGGMAKGTAPCCAQLKRLPPPQVEDDYRRRLEPSLTYCQRVGNIYSGSVFLGAGWYSGRRAILRPQARGPVLLRLGLLLRVLQRNGGSALATGGRLAPPRFASGRPLPVEHGGIRPAAPLESRPAVRRAKRGNRLCLLRTFFNRIGSAGNCLACSGSRTIIESTSGSDATPS